jgi:hypothetical protein
MKNLFVLFFMPSILFSQNINTELLGKWGEGLCGAIEVDSNYIYKGNGSNLEIRKISEGYRLISKIQAYDLITDIIKDSIFLFVATENYGLIVYDISNIDHPIDISAVLLPGTTYKISLQNNLIYSANLSEGIRIINVEDPYNPAEINSYTNGQIIGYIAIWDNYLYILQQNYSGLEILNVDNPYFPAVVGILNLSLPPTDIYIIDTILYVTNPVSALTSYSLLDPVNPIQLSQVPRNGTKFSFDNHKIFLLKNDKVEIIDCTNPNSLVPIGTIEYLDDPIIIKAKDHHLYLSNYYKFLIIDVHDPLHPYVVDSLDAASHTKDIIIDSNYLFISNMGLRIVDISNPLNPQTVSSFLVESETDKIFKKDSLIFLVDYANDNLKIIDTKSINNPEQIAQINLYQNVVNALSTKDNLLFLSQRYSLNLWDLTSAAFPDSVGRIPLLGDVYEIVIKDSLLYTCQNPGGLVIYNISNPLSPVLISSLSTSPEISQLELISNYIIGGFWGGLKVINVSNPYLPQEVGFIPLQGSLSDVKTIDKYIYANAFAKGISVFDFSNPNNPQNVGQFFSDRGTGNIFGFEDKIVVADGKYGVPIIKNTLITGIDENDVLLQSNFVLHNNYPNPFNPTTKLTWQSPVSGWQILKIYDVLGNEVSKLVDEYRNAGSYEVMFNASMLSSGIYFYTLRAGNYAQTKKMILLK